jgi:hypothetical protein
MRDRSACLVCLVGAVLAEQTVEWAEGSRYLGLDVLAVLLSSRAWAAGFNT